jgi:hypothetical protein
MGTSNIVEGGCYHDGTPLPPLKTAPPSGVTRFHAWWHAGEDGAVAVYTRTRGVLVIGLVMAFWAIAAIVCWNLFPQYLAIPFAFGVIEFGQAVAAQRMAIIFTPTEVIYRPQISPPIRVPLKAIVSMRRTSLVYTLPLLSFRRYPKPAIALVLLLGQETVIPVDFSASGEIFRRLREATGMPIR